jgi:glycosyltransferase involved in cell wall biosynthesis
MFSGNNSCLINHPIALTITLSVIIPVYNSSAELAQCLAAVARSEYEDFEVIVVDDGSTEPIGQLVKSHEYGYLRIDGPGGPARAQPGSRISSWPLRRFHRRRRLHPS